MKKRFYINGVEDEELEKFRQLALQRMGTSLGVFVLQLLRTELDKFQSETNNSPTTSSEPNLSGNLNTISDEKQTDETQADTKANSNLRIRLSVTEKAFFSQFAKQSGMTLNALIAMILRAYREHNPKLLNNEIAELQNSNFQMLAIGRNVNQIAKQLNTMGFEASLSTSQLAAIHQEIKNHCGVVGDLIKASRKRYSYHI